MPVFGSETSLTLPSTAVWLCVSMMPGITYLPVPSMTRAPAGAAMSSPDRRDLRAADEDRAVLDRAVGDGEDGGVADEGDALLCDGRKREIASKSVQSAFLISICSR